MARYKVNQTTGELTSLDSESTNPDIIAPLQKTSIAIKNYEVNDQLIYNDTLYTVVEPIAVGEDITADTINKFWENKTWNGLTTFYGQYIWTDGENIYYSNSSNQYVLDKATSTWNPKTWNGLTKFYGSRIWTDGENIYYSDNSYQYVLDKETSTWTSKTWLGFTVLDGERIWTDGDNFYFSVSSNQYVLDKSTSTWSTKTWNGLTSFYGDYIWTDGENIYYSNSSNQYVLDKSTSTWNTKTWNGYNSMYGNNIWSDGENIYYSYNDIDSSNQYVLDKSTSTWIQKIWNELTDIFGYNIWADEDNIYYSYNDKQYVLKAISISKIEPSDNITKQIGSIKNIVGETDISSVGSTVTGAILNLHSCDLLLSTGTTGTHDIPNIENYRLIIICPSQYSSGSSMPCSNFIIPVAFITGNYGRPYQTDGKTNNWYWSFTFNSATVFNFISKNGSYIEDGYLFVYGIK